MKGDKSSSIPNRAGVDMTTAQALAVLEKERQDRAQACLDEILETLKKHVCRIDHGIYIGCDGKAVPRFGVVAE